MTREEMKDRLKAFAVRIIKLGDKLPGTQAGKAIGNQIVRSGTSPGANYRAACIGKSDKDFLNKLKMVEEELDETLYWLELIMEHNQIYSGVKDAKADLLKLKPTLDEDTGPSFEELLKLNPDVCAWLTLDGTEVDYPILQGEDNYEYLNKNVYGEFALSGSLYLDSNNSRDFTDKYSLIYGQIGRAHV